MNTEYTRVDPDNYPFKLKKLLDKHPPLVYNVGINSEREDRGILTNEADEKALDKFRDQNPWINPGRGKPIASRTLFMYLSYKEILETAWEKVKDEFPEGTFPVFAGGMFRDFVFNKRSCDYDVFVNTHRMSPEQVQDAVALWVYYTNLKASRRTDFGEDTERSSQSFNGISPREESLESKQNKPDDTFVLYDFTPEDFGFDFGFYKPPNLQIIAKDFGPDVTTPLDYVKNFDYNHVMMAAPVLGNPELHISSEAQVGYGPSLLNLFFTPTAKARMSNRLNDLFYEKNGKHYKEKNLFTNTTYASEKQKIKRNFVEEHSKQLLKIKPTMSLR